MEDFAKVFVIKDMERGFDIRLNMEKNLIEEYDYTFLMYTLEYMDDLIRKHLGYDSFKYDMIKTVYILGKSNKINNVFVELTDHAEDILRNGSYSSILQDNFGIDHLLLTHEIVDGKTVEFLNFKLRVS